MGGDEILVQGRNRAKAKGDLEQWKVLLLIQFAIIFKSLFQVLSHALDRIMLGVFCLLLLAASIFFAMMTNGTCIHNGKVITVSEVSRGQETNPFQEDI